MKKKTKTALGVGVVLLAGIVTAVGVGSSGFHNWKISEWFNHWGKGEPSNESSVCAVDDVVEAAESSFVVVSIEGTSII